MRARLPLALAAAALVFAACATDDDEAATDDDATAEPDADAATEPDGAADGETDGETDAAATDDVDAASAGDLIIAIGGDETSLNPYTYTTGYPGWNLLGLIHDSLLVLDENNEPQALLATDWTVSEDGLTYSLTLRDDVTWHDGEAFDADDVAFTFEYVVEYAHPRWTPGVAAVDSVTVDSPTEVSIQLTAPSPDFPVRPLADMPILAEHVWSSVTDPQNSGEAENIGTGPYAFGSYTPDQSYTLTANPDYAMGTPVAETVNLAIIPEPSTAFAALRAGEVDMVADIVEPQLLAEFEADAAIDVQVGPGFGSTLLNIDNQKPPLDNVELRRAIGLAIDPQALIDTVLLGTGTLPNPGFLHPDGPVTVAPPAHVYDPAEAAALLDELGASVGDDGVRELDGEPLRFELMVQSDNPERIRTAELVAEQLGEVGITVDVVALDPNTLGEFVWPGFDVTNGQDYEMSMWGWSPPVQLDAGRFGSLVHSDTAIGTFNLTGLIDSDMDALVDAMNTAPSVEEREPIIADVQQRIDELRPFITLYYADGAYAFRPDSFDGWVYQAGQGPLGKISLVAAG